MVVVEFDKSANRACRNEVPPSLQQQNEVKMEIYIAPQHYTKLNPLHYPILLHF